jgi:hypothetical protein
MLTFATDFWPLFWTLLGGAAALTVLCSVLIAMRSRQPQPVPVQHSAYLAELATADRAYERQAA